ncbi:MAG: FxsA family protein [Pseudomonadota bacterium]
MWLLIAFIAVPLIEIGLFIQVGGWLGLWPTLGIVLLTAVAGTALVRSQGMQVLGKLQGSMAGQGNPAEQIVHGAMILFSGALLLTPGFFTDAVGFALLVPAVRTAVFEWGRKNVKLQSVHMQAGMGPMNAQHAPRSDTIDGTFDEVDPDSVAPKPGEQPSSWTKGR